MVRTASLALILGLLGGCSGSSAIGQADGGDGGAMPVAICNGGSAQCQCASDGDCVFSVYPRVANEETCFCPSPCPYNPVRADQAPVRESAYQQFCAGGGGFGVPDGGCQPDPVSCVTLQARCLDGVCTGF